MRSDHALLELGRDLLARQPLKLALGLASAHIAYPIAERAERRGVSPQLSAMRECMSGRWRSGWSGRAPR